VDGIRKMARFVPIVQKTKEPGANLGRFEQHKQKLEKKVGIFRRGETKVPCSPREKKKKDTVKGGSLERTMAEKKKMPAGEGPSGPQTVRGASSRAVTPVQENSEKTVIKKEKKRAFPGRKRYCRPDQQAWCSD